MTVSHEDEGHPLSEWASHKLMMVKMMMTVVVMGMMAMTVKMWTPLVRAGFLQAGCQQSLVV